MINSTPLCVDCVQIITNPLCPFCFTREVMAWVRDREISSKLSSKILGNFGNLLEEAEESQTDINCVVCGSERVNLCAYCFTNKSKNIMRRLLEEELSERFDEDFNIQIFVA